MGRWTFRVALVFAVFVSFSLGQDDSDCDTTPVTFLADFQRSCLQSFSLPEPTCTDALDAFVQAVAIENPASVTPSSYDPYFAILPIAPGESRTLLWTRTDDLVDLLSMMMATGNIISSFNIPASGIINDIGRNINWCGDPDMPGSLDTTNRCPCVVTRNFFEKLSSTLALETSGTFFFLGNGETDGGIFRSGSFFERDELPNLQHPRVRRAVVLNVHRAGMGEACGQGSSCTLQERVEEMNFSYICYNIYGNVTDASQTASLAQCANAIITAEQQGMEPDPNSCFSVGGAVAVISAGWLVLLMLSLLMLYI